MLPPARPSVARVRVLDEDPDLAEAVPAGQRAIASEHCIAPMLTVPRGDWAANRMKVMTDGIGLLMLDGLIIRRVGIDGRFGAELLGEGDLLRPWQGEDIQSNLPHTTGLKVIEASRVAVLGGDVATRFARYPCLFGALTAKALERSRRLALNMAIIHHPRIDVRVHMLLWHLADRWGRVRRDGITLPLRLTHATIADLVAAQRPSVTMSLSKLADRGLVSANGGGWLLLGEPPGELLELQEVAVGT